MKNLLTAADPPIADSGAERRTRVRVSQLLLELGQATAAELGDRLGLSSAAIRRHLDAMLAAGMIASAPVEGSARRGRGRPARAFALTESGRDSFPHAYDALAASALSFMAAQMGEQAIERFAAARSNDLVSRYGDRITGASAEERAQALAAALTEDGYAATAVDGQVCQHHCPVQHVAEQFPQLCEAETEAFTKLLGEPVLRLTTIAHGESCCTASISRRQSI
ncbi:MAG: helix-turn-helix domain-containing protein [Mycobacteriales bacterium]